jgi:hypothetical protein
VVTDFSFLRNSKNVWLIHFVSKLHCKHIT